MKILVINGPNLGRLGTREPALYGSTTLQELEAGLVARGAELGAEVACVQFDDAAAILDAVATSDADALIINPAALTHYSQTLREAIEQRALPVYEVHITNIYAREPYRRHSLISPVARASVIGFGVQGYLMALEAAVREGIR